MKVRIIYRSDFSMAMRNVKQCSAFYRRIRVHKSLPPYIWWCGRKKNDLPWNVHSWIPKIYEYVTLQFKLNFTGVFMVKNIQMRKLHGLSRFSSVQLLSRVRLFATPWIALGQASLSITNSRSSLRLTCIESVMPSSHLILLSPSPLAPNPSQHQNLFQWVNSSQEVAKVLEF